MKKLSDLGNPFATIIFTKSSGMAVTVAKLNQSTNVSFDLSHQFLSPVQLVEEIGKIGVKHVMFDNLSCQLVSEFADKYALPLVTQGISVLYYLGEGYCPTNWPWVGMIEVVSSVGPNTTSGICENWLCKPVRPITQLIDSLNSEITNNQKFLIDLGAKISAQMAFKKDLQDASGQSDPKVLSQTEPAAYMRIDR